MKTKSVRRTPQEWIALRQAELRRIESQGGRPATSKLFLVPRRDLAAQQMEFTFEGPQALDKEKTATAKKTARKVGVGREKKARRS
jgi:hypothetical protein